MASSNGSSKLQADLTELELTEIASELDPSDFFMLGVRLGFSKSRLDQFQHNNPQNIVGAISTMLIKWRRDQTGLPSTIRKRLGSALKLIERTDLEESIYHAGEDKIALPPKPPCSHHPSEQATHFCERCKETTCGYCVVDIHKVHPVVPLDKHREVLASRLREKLQNIEEVCFRIESRLKVSRNPKCADTKLADQLEGNVSRAFTGAIDALVTNQALLCKEVKYIRSALTGEIWGDISSKISECKSRLSKITNVDEVDEYYDDVKGYESSMGLVDGLYRASSVDGVLSNIDHLSVKFVPTLDVTFGRLDENMGWCLEKEFPLPRDKADDMMACIALTGRSVAVGYHDGGVDIIDIDSEHQERILNDITARSLAQMSDGRLVVCDSRRETVIYTCTLAGKETTSEVTCTLKDSAKRRCVATDSNDNIYIASTEFNEIEYFDPSGKSTKTTIKTEDKPWFISILQNDHIAVTECKKGTKHAVTIISKDGKVRYKIPGADDLAPFSTADSLDRIYVAMQADDGKVSISKYTPKGEFMEVITENLQTLNKKRSWIQLCCPSPSELVVCDLKSVFVFRRRLTLTDLRCITE